MATVIETSYVDDIDGAPLRREDMRVVEWSWRGVHYVLETSDHNLGRIESGTTPFATVLASSSRVSSHARTGGLLRPPVVSVSESMAIRRWGRQNGHRVSERGRISAVVLAAFATAH